MGKCIKSLLLIRLRVVPEETCKTIDWNAVDDMKYIKYFKLYHLSLGAIQQVSTVVISFPSNRGNMQAYILSLIIRFMSM